MATGLWSYTTRWDATVEHCAFLLISGTGTGYFDLYCQRIPGTSGDATWSLTHTEQTSCFKVLP